MGNILNQIWRAFWAIVFIVAVLVYFGITTWYGAGHSIGDFFDGLGDLFGGARDGARDDPPAAGEL